ncbi:MAG TPA: cytochrome c family protein [Candidatus Eisenbacteria bacterium]|nr:cytochrome c family protein [Candidatus Eisenbacteria bacterium]
MRTPRFLIWAGMLVIGSYGIASAEEAAKPAPIFVGVKKCKTCHNSEKGGAQYTKWTESKHSKAFEVLASEKALAIAKEKGIADPQKADECLQCHVTGHGEPAEHFGAGYLATDGVGCESCHGAGSNYIKMKTMQGLRDGTIKPEDVGFRMPNKETCAHCHNEKATGGQFVDWPADSAKISHGIPAGYKRGAATEGAGKTAE